ncbi:non-ribosomal peptide synthetase [Amycolatopsis pigmentata]|uniref:AMP-binding protein n=1 Tax=Amycolatopsis pigmentata TaxID=450801 RepID=A0ABW5G476_9PSEU
MTSARSSTDRGWQRPVSPIEWIYQANPAETSMTPQIFVEGTGTLDAGELAAAVGAAAQVCPGARLTRKGRVWVDSGRPPEVRVIDGAGLDRVNYAHPGLDRPLRGDRGGPLSEVVLLTGEAPVLVFRSHHSIMDGRGLQLWIGEVFRALRGEPLIGASSPLTETRLIRQVGVPDGVRPRLLKGDAAFRARGPFRSRGGIMRRLTVAGVHPAVLARVAATANKVCGLAAGTFFFPVDLRRHLPDIRATGNLTTGIGVRLNPDSTWQQIYAEVLDALAKDTDLASFPNLDAIESIVRVPQAFMRVTVKLLDTILSYTPRNAWSFALTHLGRLDLADYATNTFVPSTVFGVPRRGYFFPPSFTVVELPGHTEITFTSDGGPQSAERAEELLEAIASDLGDSTAHTDNRVLPEVVSLSREKSARAAPGAPPPAAASALELVRQHAARRPRSVALIEPGGRSIDYGRLVGVLSSLATALRDAGVGQGDRVATILPDGLDAGVLFLAVATVAVSAPLNPAYSESELDNAFALLEPALLVVRPGLSTTAREVAKRHGIPVAELERDDDSFRITLDEPARRRGPSGPHHGESLVLQTSGTTGQGKLVPLTWPTMLAAAEASAKAYGLTSADRRLNIMPLFHVQGLVGSLLAALCCGSSVVCADTFLPGDILNWLTKHDVTWFSASPAMHQRILEHAPEDWLPPRALRFVRSGSAALSPVLRTALERFYRIPIVESYGMTEAHQIASTPVRLGVTAMVPTGSTIGLLADGVVSTRAGVRGEIVVSGANVISRYLVPEEANATAFVDGWFRTGDEGELTESGELRITGRIKDLIIRGGEKVAPVEVENALKRHPAVRQVAVCGVPGPGFTEQVAAVVVLEEDAAATPGELRAFARSALAPYKVPTLFDYREELPVSSGGKVSRASLARELKLKLPAIGHEAGRPASRDPEDVVRTPLEANLAGLWAQVLGVESVGIHDDFFTLGGQSIEGIALVAAVNQTLHTSVEPLTLFDEGNTVRKMARLIESRRLLPSSETTGEASR